MFFYHHELQLLKTFLAFIERDDLHCDHRSYLNFRCILETTSFGNTFEGHIALWPYICCNMCNISVGKISSNSAELDINIFFLKLSFCFWQTWTTTVYWYTLSEITLHCRRNSSSTLLMSHVPLRHGKIAPLLQARLQISAQILSVLILVVRGFAFC